MMYIITLPRVFTLLWFHLFSQSRGAHFSSSSSSTCSPLWIICKTMCFWFVV
ncbi:MAG: hypothetical protein K6253_02450 [Candidatus Liberibacter asiaticus]|nr:hypothetical protein [Candidatus Liberibacter asiaticus]